MAGNSAPPNTHKYNLNGRPVLVQNGSGIYYGTLEKLDTRDGTALLSNGYAISSKKHITYAQYNHIIKSRSITNQILEEHDEEQSKNDKIFASAIAESYGGNEIDYVAADFDMVKTIADGNTITDYAIEGIAKYETVHDTNYATLGTALGLIEASSLTVEIISLTGVTAVLPISNDQDLSIREKADEDPEDFSTPVAATFIAAGKNSFEWTIEGYVTKGRFFEGKFEPGPGKTKDGIVSHVKGPRLIAFRSTKNHKIEKIQEK